jgi:hypothetical protein
MKMDLQETDREVLDWNDPASKGKQEFPVQR